MTIWYRWLHRRALEHELDAELRDHIEREIAAGVAMALDVVTLLATYLPVRRASGVAPVIALRSQM